MSDNQVFSEASVVGGQQDEQIGTAVVVAITGISDRSIFRRIEKGLFPAGTRVGRVWKWNRSEVEQWLAEHPVDKRVKPKVPAPSKAPKPKKKKPKPTKGGVAQVVVPCAVPDAIPSAMPGTIPEAVIAAVMDVQPVVGADLVAMEVGGVA